MDNKTIENPQTQSNLAVEYEQTNQNFRFLGEVRFKLLALIPTIGGAAVFILSKLGLSVTDAQQYAQDILLLVLLTSVLGFLATFGLTLYDQRNSQLYNALIHRARHIEQLFTLPRSPGSLKESAFGGQFNERPDQRRRLIVVAAGHDLGLAFIYGPILGSWLFPIAYTLLRATCLAAASARLTSAGIALIAALGFTLVLIRQDQRERTKYHEAWERDQKAMSQP